jgi:hypothetical protein
MDDYLIVVRLQNLNIRLTFELTGDETHYQNGMGFGSGYDCGLQNGNGTSTYLSSNALLRTLDQSIRLTNNN